GSAMTRGFKGFAALASSLLVCGGAGIARAGECVNDWPNPDECFPDILCPQYSEYWDMRRAVVHIVGPDIGGTGVLINNIDCVALGACGTPYLLTAAHIVSEHYGSELTENEKTNIQTLSTFTFGLEAGICG